MRRPSLPMPLFLLLVASVQSGAAGAQSPAPFGTPQPGREPQTVLAVSGTRAAGWPLQTRSEVVARHGIVASSDPLASQSGLEILRRGGNAIDAAVATAAVLAVTSQNDTGIGGDLFAIVWDARSQRLYALNSAGRAPAAWTPDWFRKTLGVTSVPRWGVNAVTVPGAVAGYDALLSRFGTLGFREVLAPAARIAEEGWGLGERRHYDLTLARDGLREDPDSRALFLRDGEVPPLYSILRNEPLARTLRILQSRGARAFYEGEIAEAIVRKVHAGGGVMSRADLASYRPRWVETLSSNYHGYDIHQLPAPTQGMATLEMLNIAAECAPVLGLDLARTSPLSAQRWHFLVEAKKLAYADLYARNGDPDFVAVPQARLVSHEYARTRCKAIDMKHAGPTNVVGGMDGGTVYLAAADRWGNMVSLVQSVFSVYGSRASVGEYGFILQNRGAAFSLEAGHPNVVAPGKQPFHTILAGFIMKDGRPLMAFGNMGGAIQPEMHAQHVVNLVDHGMNVQMTSDAARFTHDQNTNVLWLEGDLFNQVGSDLAALGHVVRRGDGSQMGGYQGILMQEGSKAASGQSASEPKGDAPFIGLYRAGSDHRKDGQAAGY